LAIPTAVVDAVEMTLVLWQAPLQRIMLAIARCRRRIRSDTRASLEREGIYSAPLSIPPAVFSGFLESYRKELILEAI